MADKLRIINMGLQRVGAKRLTSLTENTRERLAVDAAYDDVVEQELMTNVWTFATRRVELSADESSRPASVTITAAGSGYVVGEFLTVSGGTLAAGGAAARYYISAVDGSGGVTAVELAEDEVGYSTAPSNPASTTTDGSGAGCTLTVTYEQTPPFGRSYRYRLPFDYLRAAPYDPTQAAVYREYLVEGEFLLSDNSSTVDMRYVSDLSGLSARESLFHPLFANAISMRLAAEVAEELTGSSAKVDRVESAYVKFVNDARRIDAIERGPTEPEIDEWVGVRVSERLSPALRKYS